MADLPLQPNTLFAVPVLADRVAMLQSGDAQKCEMMEREQQTCLELDPNSTPNIALGAVSGDSNMCLLRHGQGIDASECLEVSGFTFSALGH